MPNLLRSWLVIICTFAAALALILLPLPHWARPFRPEWVTLVLIYWVIALPHRVSVGCAWILGLLLDVIYGTVLGEHALALMVLAYIASKLHRQLRMFPVWQQASSIFVLLLMYQLLILWVQGVMGQLTGYGLFWLTIFTSTIIWPWLFVLLRDIRRRFKVH